MKLLIIFSTLIFTVTASDDSNDELPIGLTEEESSRLHEIYDMGRNTDPPPPPVRNVSEFERMRGVVIRYPFGISTSIISEMSENVTIYCLVASNQQSSASNSMENGGVNMENVEFVIGSTDSYWTRDYGPWWVVDGNRNMSIADFTYNRPRQNDNAAPLKMSEHLSVPYYASDIVHAGGNYMTDGLGIAASSDLVFEENEIANEEVFQLFENYYGVTTYHVLDDPNNTYIDHIDCWGKYLSPTKVLIREVPPTHPQFDEIEETANYFANSLNKWDEPWEVYRVWTPNNQPYTNSLILNEKVLVPITDIDWDDEALAVYHEALPGYEILGFTGSWESTDALHCRIIGVPDLEMLQVFHNPINDYTEPGDSGYTVNIFVDDLSNLGIIQDSVKLFWKTFDMDSWLSSELLVLEMPSDSNTWSGYIPLMTDTTYIQYFLQAMDSSGRIEKSPLAGWHDFIALPTDMCEEWLLGDLNNTGQSDVFDILLLSDRVASDNASGICSESVSDINQDDDVTVIDVIFLVNMILNPS